VQGGMTRLYVVDHCNTYEASQHPAQDAGQLILYNYTTKNAFSRVGENEYQSNHYQVSVYDVDGCFLSNA
jgi:hypothetical protein